MSRGLHGTATLLPDGTVFFAGENREALVRPDDPSFPMMSSYAGVLPRGDPDLGVPVGQVFSPPYLFKQGGGQAARPVIRKAPGSDRLRRPFRHRGRRATRRRSARWCCLRSDHNTHSLTTGDRYVKLAFRTKGGGDEGKGDDKGKVRVMAPALPAQAVPGIYMLFVLDSKGVPSAGIASTSSRKPAGEAFGSSNAQRTEGS